MRKKDRERLRVRTNGSADSDEALADALGAGVDATRELVREIFSDFDEAALGVGWWSPHPGTQRRILISDHMYQCGRSIETNLVEARLHFLECLDALD